MFKRAGRFLGKEGLIWGSLVAAPVLPLEIANGIGEMIEKEDGYEFALDYGDPATYVGLLAFAALMRTVIQGARDISYYSGRLDRSEGTYKREPKW